MNLLIWCGKCNGNYPAGTDNTWVHDGKLNSRCPECSTKTEAIIHISSSTEKQKKKM